MPCGKAFPYLDHFEKTNVTELGGYRKSERSLEAERRQIQAKILKLFASLEQSKLRLDHRSLVKRASERVVRRSAVAPTVRRQWFGQV